MEYQELLECFTTAVSESIALIPEGEDRFVVRTPFTFDDGDVLKVVLKREGEEWYLTDEGHTFMHLSFEGEDIDTKGLDRVLARHKVENRDGELRLRLDDQRIGDSLFSFLELLTKLSALTDPSLVMSSNKAMRGKEFDSVKMMREIRNKMSGDIQGMTLEEEREYLSKPITKSG